MLILTPLAVGRQMRAEAAVMGIDVVPSGESVPARGPASRSPTTSGCITSAPADFAGIVLDESIDP